MLVGAVDVGLLGRELRVAHTANLAVTGRDPCRARGRRESVNRSEFLALAAAAPFGAARRPDGAAAVGARHVRRRGAARGGRPAARSASSARFATVAGSARDRARRRPRRRLPHRGRRRLDRRPPRRAASCCAGLVEPRYTVAHPDGRHAFVTDSGRSSVTALDVATGRHRSAACKLPGWARHLTIDRAGRRLWVSPRLGLGARRRRRRRRAAARGDADARLRRARRRHRARRAALGDRRRASARLAVGDAVHAADAAPQHVTFGDGKAFVTSGDAGVLRVQDLRRAASCARRRFPSGRTTSSTASAA